MNTRPVQLLAASLTTATSFKSQILSLLKPGRWIRIYSNQKDVEYISASNIRVAFDTRPPQQHNSYLFYFSPALLSLTFYEPPPRPPSLSMFCDRRISSFILFFCLQ